MGNCFGPKCFLASSFILLTILSIYGIVGTVMNWEQASKIHTYGEWPFNIRALYYAFAIIQILFPAAGLLGLVAACKNEPMFLYGSGSFLLGIFTSCCVFGSVSMRLNTETVIDEFYMTVRRNLNDTKMFEWMDDVQWQYMCCGVYSYIDWLQFGERESVPSSCCRRDKVVSKGSCGAGILKDSNDSSTLEPSEFIYTHGCGPKLAETILSTAKHLGTEILLAGGVSLVVAIFLYACVTKLFVTNGRCSCVKTDFNGNEINGKDNPNSPSSTNASSSAGGMSNVRTIDSNNNHHHASRPKKSVYSPNREKYRMFDKRRKRANGSNYRINQPFGPINSSHTKFLGPSSKNEINGNVSASKSFILGEAQSHLLNNLRDGNDPELLRKNVDMLWYQSVDKNMSTLSTTPNDISSLNFPSIWQNRRHIFGSDLLAVLSEDEQNTVYTLVSERPFTPSLSQNCSISIFNNQGKALNGNGEGSAPSAHGPTALPNMINKTQRLTSPVPLQEEELLEESEIDSTALAEDAVATTAALNSSTPPILPQTQPGTISEKEHTCIMEEPKIIVEDDSSNESLINQVTGATVPPPPTTPAAKYQNPTSTTVRSSTLATIHEESESTKGSPTKAASPASGFMSPECVTPKPTKMNLSNAENGENRNAINTSALGCDNCEANSADGKYSMGDNENFECPVMMMNVAVADGFKVEGNEASKMGQEVVINDSLGESELRGIAKSQTSQVAPDLNQNQTSLENAVFEGRNRNEAPTPVSF